MLKWDTGYASPKALRTGKLDRKVWICLKNLKSAFKNGQDCAQDLKALQENSEPKMMLSIIEDTSL
jgi:hypothetical protein